MQLILENERVKLTPLTLENYENLFPIASQKKLVQYSPSDIETPEALKNYVLVALEQQAQKSGIPFIIFDKAAQSYAGSNRSEQGNETAHATPCLYGHGF
jgi:uncharacterized membrane protein